ncbi:MAG: UDP-N-acetylmuramate--L-alanine ligase [bacterium]
MFERIKNIHFVGIGGSGMSGIAEVFYNLGYNVSGSDMQKGSITNRLKKLGIKIFIGHNARNVRGAHVVVTSTAIPRNNGEIKEAQKSGIPVIARIEMLAELARLKYTVSVAGTHGKTTTTSMVAFILREGKLDPTIIVGGIINNIGTGARLGDGDFLIAEADESDGSFLKLSPTIVIVTNIDDDHVDYYGSMKNLTSAFAEHINKIPFYGTAIVNGDDPYIKRIMPGINRKMVTFGMSASNDYHPRIIAQEGYKTTFSVMKKTKNFGSITLHVPGKHNVLNAMAAAITGLQVGVSFGSIKRAFREFAGVKRRLEIKGTVNDILVIDDYGHHPTAIKEVLTTIKQAWPRRRLVVLFQPHRYTRTKALYREFAIVLKNADVIRLLDIYPASEKPIKGVHSSMIVDWLKKRGVESHMVKFNDPALKRSLKPGDIFLSLGAGNVWKVGEWLLKNRQAVNNV